MVRLIGCHAASKVWKNESGQEARRSGNHHFSQLRHVTRSRTVIVGSDLTIVAVNRVSLTYIPYLNYFCLERGTAVHSLAARG